MEMTKDELLNKAIRIAEKAHKGQKDKYHTPYIGHVMRVVSYGKTLDEKIVGALHDVIEDNEEYTIDSLRELGFPENILFAVSCLTKYPNDTDYMEFIQKIEMSPLAVSVKMNDLKDNMDLTRVNRPLTNKDLKRLNKYLIAYRYLVDKY